MAKGRSVFFCQSCGHESSKWMGQCPACGEWNTFTEERIERAAARDRKAAKDITVTPLSKVDTVMSMRYSTGMRELDRVLGGGVVPGSLILVGGDPGIGKSTLLLQVCRNFSGGGMDVLYISGEESARQIRLRADRMGEFSDSMCLMCETNIADVRAVIETRRPPVVVIDSIQTMFSDEISSAPGSVSQVREATGVFMRLAKDLSITIFIVGHVTKEGTVAGPKVLEHMVDTVLYFEGDRYAAYRILRGVKNRFGATNEVGVFEMHEGGLREVENPSEFMLSGKPEDATGSIVTCSLEGTRPILLEIQALVTKSAMANPRRSATGCDYNRVSLIMAVLEKRLNFPLSVCDGFVNIAGGMRINEPAVDLGIALAIISSFKDMVIPGSTVCFGEVGLSGEVRAVSMAESRAKEAAKLGFTRCIMPAASMTGMKAPAGIECIGVRNIKEAMEAVSARR